MSLHGGPVGFDALPWTVLTDKDTIQLFSKTEVAHIRALPQSTYAVFRLESPSGDQGYPGSLIAEVLLALVSPGNSQSPLVSGRQPTEEYSVGGLVIVYRTCLREANSITPVNLTQVGYRSTFANYRSSIFPQHWGFNLEASLNQGPGTLIVKDHTLTIQVIPFHTEIS